MSQAGKGPEWRKGTDYKKYWTNFPNLSANDIKAKEVKKKKGKTIYKY